MTRPRVFDAGARAGIALGLAIPLAACAAPAVPTPPSTEPSSTVAWVDDEPTNPPARPPIDDLGLALAQERGVAALSLFLRPDAPSDEWLTALTPYLTPDAYDAFTAGKPANLARVDIYADQATVAEHATAVTAIVIVPTSGGTWHVSMTRSGIDDPWFVGRFQPPYS